MKTNLIYFTPSSHSKRAISLLLPAFSYGSLSTIVSQTELGEGVTAQDIQPFLTQNALIMLDFSNDEQFQLIQSAVSKVFRSPIQNTDFGGFCAANGKYCLILNIGKTVDLDPAKLHELFNIHPSICLKLWGLTVAEVKEKCAQVSNFSSLNHIIFDSFGDITLAVESCDQSYLLSELYQVLSSYIYFEEFSPLIDVFASILSVRKREFGVLDLTGGEVLTYLQSHPVIKPFCIDLANLGVSKTTTMEEIRAILYHRKLEFAALLVPHKSGFKAIFIDDEVHSFDIPLVESFPSEYLKNFVLFKMFNKFRKNTFLY